MKQIFEPVQLNHLPLKNRLVRSATWEGIANPDGGITEIAYEIYRELAQGGVGGIITGFTSVSAQDHYFEGMMRLSEDRLVPQYRKLTDIIHAENCPVIAQLALGGYYRAMSRGRLRLVEPDDMTEAEIRHVIEQFGAAARRAEQANFDGVQIHAAHFFFLSRFISPRVNHRSDQYGGSTENRMRILLEVLKEIREQTTDLHVTVKINCNDFTPGGLTEAESHAICKALASAGIDSIEVSGNGTSVAGIKPHVNEGYFAPFAVQLAEELDVPVILVGGLRSKETMEAILDQTKIELLSLSRPLLRDPDFPNKLRTGACTESKCVSCNGCYSSQLHRCVFR